MVLDCFTYYDEYGKELLLLRYNILKEYVDKFVIIEANKSQTGEPYSYKCKQRIAEWGLPEDHFEIVEFEIPEDDDLVCEEIDVLNLTDNISGGFNGKLSSLKCRIRERLQRDILVDVLKKYRGDSFVIFGDLDEILNPDYIAKLQNVIFMDLENHIVYTHLIWLQGQANLQVFERELNKQKIWSCQCVTSNALFQRTTPTKLRSMKLLPDNCRHYFLMDDEGSPCNEMGWHLSWMGDGEHKIKKVKSWPHFFDTFDWHIYKSYSSPDYLEFLSKEFKHRDPSPCGANHYILNEIPIDKLPKQIFEIPEVENYLFPYSKTTRSSKELNMELLNEFNQYINLDHVEQQERFIVEKFLNEDETVLELGGRYGVISCLINKRIKNPRHHVVVEPDSTVWETLKNNLKTNGCAPYIVKGFISNEKLDLDSRGYISKAYKNPNSKIPCYTLDEIKKLCNIKKFTVLVADCEGCLGSLFEENPQLYKELKMITFEEDCTDICDYKIIRENLEKNNFEELISGHQNLWIKIV